MHWEGIEGVGALGRDGGSWCTGKGWRALVHWEGMESVGALGRDGGCYYHVA